MGRAKSRLTQHSKLAVALDAHSPAVVASAARMSRSGADSRPESGANHTPKGRTPPLRPTSARAREAEVDLARARIRPARGDDLRARIELHALGSVHVQVPDEA